MVAFIEEVHQVRGAKESISLRDKVQDYHDILKFIFTDLIDLQRRGILHGIFLNIVGY
jgi:hypothetical protein